MASAGIDPRHIVMFQNKPFVKCAGLLELAHAKGLLGFGAFESNGQLEQQLILSSARSCQKGRP